MKRIIQSSGVFILSATGYLMLYMRFYDKAGPEIFMGIIASILLTLFICIILSFVVFGLKKIFTQLEVNKLLITAFIIIGFLDLIILRKYHIYSVSAVITILYLYYTKK